MTAAPPTGGAFRNIVQSLGAGLSTSIAGFASSVIVARLLGVSGTGSIAIALWIVFVAITIFDGGLSATLARFVPEARGRGDDAGVAAAERFLWRRFRILLVLGIAALAAAYPLYWSQLMVAYTAGSVDNGVFYALIMLCFAVHMMFAFGYHRLRAHQQFDRIGRRSLIGAALQIVCVAGLAIAFGPAGALAGYIVGSIPIALIACWSRVGAERVPAELAHRITRYARSLWVASLLSPLLWSRVDLFLVGHYADARAVGLFAAASVIAALLLQICQMICNALLPNLVIETRERSGVGDVDRLRNAAARTIDRLTLILLPICFGAAALAPLAIGVVFGSAFADAATCAMLLAIAAAASAVTLICSNILNLVERNGSLVSSGAVGAVLTIMLCVVLIPPYGIVGAAGARVVAQSAVAMVTLYQTARCVPGAVAWWPLVAKLVASVAACGAAAMVADSMNDLQAIPVAIAAGVLMFAAAIAILLPLTRDGRRQFIEVIDLARKLGV